MVLNGPGPVPDRGVLPTLTGLAFAPAVRGDPPTPLPEIAVSPEKLTAQQRPAVTRTRRQPEAFAERLQNSREWERPASHAIPTGRSRWPYRVVKVGVRREV